MKTIIFVCTGNTCRSPMAEAIAKNILDIEGFDIISRGLFVAFKSGMNEKAKCILAKKGISMEHKSKPLTLLEVEDATLVLTMEKSHKTAILNSNIKNKENIFTLYEYVENSQDNIKDPYGEDEEAYLKCFEEIYGIIKQIKF